MEDEATFSPEVIISYARIEILEVDLDPMEEELFDIYEQNGFSKSVYDDGQKTILESKQDSFYSQYEQIQTEKKKVDAERKAMI